MDALRIDYDQTGHLPIAVLHYLRDHSSLRNLYSYRPDASGFVNLMQAKRGSINREILFGVLKEQYQQHLASQTTVSDKTKKNIELLKFDNTFTITTGHQLNIFTGPLYFIFKIATAIKLAKELKRMAPDKNFVPLYWMASEDHDFAEINHTWLGDKKITWQQTLKGATGRLPTQSMDQIIQAYKDVLDYKENYAHELATLFEVAYTSFAKLADAMRYLVNQLFGQYGLLILDPDDIRLKQQMVDIMQKDILQQSSFTYVSSSNKQLRQLGLQPQVNPREINFFYLKDHLRERLVYQDQAYRVLHTDISFSKEALIKEISQYPDRFSPNVLTRLLYQELVLPNLAYVGGNAEINYCLQLKSTFDYYQVDFPILVLRHSGWIIKRKTAYQMQKMSLAIEDIFQSKEWIKNKWVRQHSIHNLSLHDELETLQGIFDKMKSRVAQIDPTLCHTTETIQKKVEYEINKLEKKLVQAELKNKQVIFNRIEKIKDELFPDGVLQERKENFSPYYARWGQGFIEELIQLIQPLNFKFTIIKE